VSKRLFRSRAIRYTLGVLIVGLLVVWALRPSPVPVDTAAAERGTLIVTLDEEGETRVRDRYVISAPVPGRMQRIELEPGDPVKANSTVLAIFAPTDPVPLDARTRAELQARVNAAQAAVGSATAERDRVAADLEFARREVERYTLLEREGVVSKEQVDQQQRQARTLEEALKAAEYTVQTARHQLEVARASLLQQGSGGPTIQLRSPVDGVVLRLLQESETVVPTGQPLIEVGDVSQLELVSDFLSTAAVRVQPGQRVIVDQWGGPDPLKARVRLVEPSGFTKISALGVEEQRVNVIMDFVGADEEWTRLGDGYRVEVRVVVSERHNVVKVPASSLFRHEDGWALFAVVDGRAVLRRVEIGEQNGLEAEIVSGLDEGEQVIMFPGDNVTDGVAVTPRT
jgi:HlyD family secretion protein